MAEMTLKAPGPVLPTVSQSGAPCTLLASPLLRFGAISGLTWLLDFATLYLLVRAAHLPVFAANLLSASLAATVAFLLSHKLAFAGRRDGLLLRTLVYCAYTFAVILVASAAISYVAALTHHLSDARHLQLTAGTCALLAKLFITPFNFVLNFLVARFVSQYAPTAS